MGIYAGVDGVVRQINSLDAGRSYSVYHTHSYKAGVEGVVRDLTDVVSQIDHLEISFEWVYTATIDTNGDWVEYDGYDLATANANGKIEIASNYIYVYCYKALKSINAEAYFYIVFKDGHKVSFRELLNDAPGLNFQLTVYAYEYFSTTGWYRNYCLGTAIIDAYVSGSRSARKYLTAADGNYADLYSALRYNGTTYAHQKYEAFTINGVSIPIKVVNNLS